MSTNENNKSVILAMSGGVDSSVAAYLLKQQGYNVTGVTMRLCEEYCDNDDVCGTGTADGASTDIELCPAASNIDLARSVADKLDMEFMVLDYRNEFQEFVINPFVESYEKGLTPNPCIECNKNIKFSMLANDSDEGYERDMEHAPLLATGHYARVMPSSDLSVSGTSSCQGADGNTTDCLSDCSSEIHFLDSRSDSCIDSCNDARYVPCDICSSELAWNDYVLCKATDFSKDQSYFLYSLDQDTLSRVIFPLGNLTKDEVRTIASEQSFTNANRKDSQDICFISDGDYYEFIKSYTGNDYPEGNFVDTQGNVLGRHKGIIKYTVGQRKGLGLSLKEPMYVFRLDMERNEVVLARDEELYSTDLIADNFNWLSIKCPVDTISFNVGTSGDVAGSIKCLVDTISFRALGRIRYRHKEAPCTVTVIDNETVSVKFDEPQRAITGGQSLVLYDIESDKYVLGGGIIRA